jgi:DNA-damage-inducible protein J
MGNQAAPQTYRKEWDMETKSALIRVQVDLDLKVEVENILKQLGLSASEAINLFYHQVRLKQGLPFTVRIPNKMTVRTFKETDAGRGKVCCDNAQDLFDKLGL